MTRPVNKKAFILFVVVMMIALVGVVSIILTSNTRLLAMRSYRVADKAQAQFSCESGIDWLKAHPQNAAAIQPDEPLVLSLTNEANGPKCTIKRIQNSSNKLTFEVAGTPGRKASTYKHKRKYTLSEGNIDLE